VKEMVTDWDSAKAKGSETGSETAREKVTGSDLARERGSETDSGWEMEMGLDSEKVTGLGMG
jgi:hypothetical protein